VYKMQNLKILNGREAKKILHLLEEQFGFTGKLEYIFLINAKEKVYVVSKDIGNIELDKLRIDTIGLYFGTLHDNEIRLTIEGSQLIGPYAKKNILELNQGQVRQYVKGYDVALETQLAPGYYLIKSGEDFLGTAKYTGEKLLTFVSKARRLRVLNE